MIKAALKQVLSERARARLRRVEQLALSPFRRGSSLYCSCCGGSFRLFLQFNGNDGIRCPYCNSLARQRFQVALLENMPGIDLSNDSILHVAPEFALSLYIKKRSPVHYLRLDSLKSFIPGICVMPDIVGNLCDLEFPSGIFTLVICNHVLEHIKADELAINELYRVLSDDGFALVTVPIRNDGLPTLEEDWIDSDELRRVHYGVESHVRFYGLDIISKFNDAGFFVGVERPENYFALDQIERRRLKFNEAHFVLTKRNIGSMFTTREQ